ncbi:MAG: hypothetical protein FJW39_27755 [Acidobacteria bacterium]|nr:hypothetical protein [Acidobacteriota bacterium]
MRRTMIFLSVVMPVLPAVHFEPNNGQAPRQARFVGRGPGFDALLLGSGAMWKSAEGMGSLQLIGAAPSDPLPERQLSGKVHYIRAAGQGTSAGTFAQIRYPGVYRGVDLVFYGNSWNQLEYDFVVAPGADPSQIRIEYEGPLKPPVAYQEIAGRRTPVESAYRFENGRVTGFRLGAYDHRHALVIDPVITTATYFGGVGGGFAEAVTVDAQGYVYVSGSIYTNHLPLENPIQDFFAGSNDIFISKFDPSGTRLIYSTYLGTIGDERPLDIAVDAQGSPYITGITTNTEFLVTPGAAQTAYAGGSVLNGGDAFVLKLSPAGDRIVYATYFGGSKDEYSRSIAVDSTGAAYIAGTTLSDDLPLNNPIQTEIRPVPEGLTYAQRDVFVAKFSPDGSKVVYSTYIGGVAVDEGYSIVVDSKLHAWVLSSTERILGSSPLIHDWPLVNQVQTDFGGSTRDIALVKLSPDGGKLLFSTIYGANGDELPRNGNCLAIDSEDNVYLTGDSGNANWPRTAPRLGIAGNREVFITKFSPEGKVVASNIFGGQMNENAFGIAVDSDKNIYVTGFTQSKNFFLKGELQGAIGSTCASNTVNCTADWFVAKFNPTLTEVLFSTYLGGTAADQARGIASGGAGGVWVTGYTQSPNMPVVNAIQGSFQGGGAVNVTYLIRIDTN